jgi:hypothetical protein
VNVLIENDVFMQRDSGYTHGTEINYRETDKIWGLRQMMYTPDDITNPDKQEGDRPWCGVFTVFYETRGVAKDRMYKYRYEAGVLGPSALSGETQRWVHKNIGSPKPVGWHNQLQDEPVLNINYEWNERVYRWFASGLDCNGGWSFGTTWGNYWRGMRYVVGHGVDRIVTVEDINPKARFIERSHLCFIVEARGMAVLNNATIGESIMRGDRDRESLKHIVGMYRYGVIAGYENLEVKVLMGERSKEFEGQKNTMEWGTISIGYNW